MAVNTPSQQHNAHDVILIQPVVIHHKNFQANTVNVSPLKMKLIGLSDLKMKLKRLVEDSSKSISFNAALPLGYSSSLVDQINLHIWICCGVECMQCSKICMYNILMLAQTNQLYWTK